jgi:hypothetical protein
VFERFRAALEAEGYGETSRWPCAYANFDNPVPIADTVPEIYRQLVTRLWAAVHRARPDMRAAFPDVPGSDRRRFLVWTVRNGLREHQLTEAFVPGSWP